MKGTRSSRVRKKRSGHGQRWEMKIKGGWFPAARKSQRPRKGGYRVMLHGRLPVMGLIEEVREIRRK